MEEGLDLAGLLTIWPIVESFATHIPVGDLITLGRTSSSLRSSLHGRSPYHNQPRRFSLPRQNDILNPEVGDHQTIDWVHLKAIALFICSSVTHTRGQRTKPCVYCSKPICDACIVRDSFKNPNENTFKNRLRYFCRDCWSEGRPTRSFRYPAINLNDEDMILQDPRHNRIDDKPHVEGSEFCECNLKDNGWLCLPCKEEQNSSTSAPSRLTSNTDQTTRTVQCYGLDCTNTIDLDSPEKDRRRVCLWCQKPLRRQLGGEDRHAWNLKTIEARARNAESRSKDLEEYNRRRLKVMRMSRHEMRGTKTTTTSSWIEPAANDDDDEDDKPIFVRHLDTVNYRNWMTQNATPSPEAVWKSKNGYWRYQRGFLHAVAMRCRSVNFRTINGVAAADLTRMTKDDGLAHARLNREMYMVPGTWKIPEKGHSERNKWCLNELRTRVLDLHLTQGNDIHRLVDVLDQQYGLEVSEYEVSQQIGRWWNAAKGQSILGTTDDIAVDGRPTTSLEIELSSDRAEEQEPLDHSSVESSREPLSEPDVGLNVEEPLDTRIPESLAEEIEEPGSDDPPPYIP